MTNTTFTTSKAGKIIYWISTLWLALGMISTGGVQLLQEKEGAGGADFVTHLGYPIYILTILGVWKFLGVIAVLVPSGKMAFLNLLREWAYAGFFFAMTGAIFSHVEMGDTASEIFPALLLLILTMVFWYFRPLNRQIISVNS